MRFLKQFVKSVLYPSCVIFTVLWFIVCVIVDSVSDTVNINLGSALMCLTLALVIACCNSVLKKDSLAFVLRYFLHMLITVISVSITVALFSLGFETAYAITGNSFYLVLILIVFYLVVATPIVFAYEKTRSKVKKAEDYQPIFKK